MTDIVIGGVTVDIDDPCALYQALYSVKLQMLSGEQVEELSIQSPVSRELVRFSPANMTALDAELMKLSAACTAKTTGKPARYAKSIRFI